MSSLQSSLNSKFIDMEKIHINDIVDIENTSYDYPWSEKIFHDCISHNYLCKVLVVDNNLIGYVISSIVQDECHIMNLCIKDSYRGHGYGGLLLDGLQKEAIAINCKLLFLECRPSNNAALKLYYSEGYNEVGIRKNYYPAPNGYEDAIMLAKNV